MITLNINGTEHQYDGDPAMPLLWYLRDELQLPGTKYGCGIGACGSCTVHQDGRAVFACLQTVGDAEGSEVTTIEGLSADGNHPVQAAWRELSVPQCGFCQSGQIMRAAALLEQNPDPSDAEIHEDLAQNICRCGCYQRIVAAVRHAATGV